MSSPILILSNDGWSRRGTPLPVGTIWDDLQPIRRNSNEYLGFATQQPVVLIERVLQRASDPGDLVVDPFCGSGTSLIAAHRQDLRWIGGDSSPEAIDLCAQRLNSEGLVVGVDWTRLSQDAVTDVDIKPIFLRRLVTMVDDFNAAEVLIGEGECEWVEWKVAAYWNAYYSKKDENNKDKVIRSVAGFLNSTEGGTLLIGVADDGSVAGLADDYRAVSSQKPGRDKYELWLRQIIGAKLGSEFDRFIKISFEEIGEKDICLIRVAAGNRPAFNGDTLPVRKGNRTNNLTLKEALQYSRIRWSE